MDFLRKGFNTEQQQIDELKMAFSSFFNLVITNEQQW